MWTELQNCSHTVHPRACGEHGEKKTLLAYQERFIPAYAGNTSALLMVCPLRPVHPRVCGEHCWRCTRMDAHHRFIPAYAGNTFMFLISRLLLAVHPRACGEHRVTGRPWMITVGSSPRMRGTRAPCNTVPCARRFIPAHAGNTIRDCKARIIRDGSSPRMRGTLFWEWVGISE